MISDVKQVLLDVVLMVKLLNNLKEINVTSVVVKQVNLDVVTMDILKKNMKMIFVAKLAHLDVVQMELQQK